MEQLIWFEVAFKGAAGLALIVLPNTTLRILGLHRDAQRFWPRIAGCVLAGIALGVLATLLTPQARGGIGPAGLIAVNLSLAAGLLSPLVWGTAAPFRRGRFAVLVLGLASLALAFLEIAHI